MNLRKRNGESFKKGKEKFKFTMAHSPMWEGYASLRNLKRDK
jgi:hypothetical protein